MTFQHKPHMLDSQLKQQQDTIDHLKQQLLAKDIELQHFATVKQQLANSRRESLDLRYELSWYIRHLNDTKQSLGESRVKMKNLREVLIKSKVLLRRAINSDNKRVETELEAQRKTIAEQQGKIKTLQRSIDEKDEYIDCLHSTLERNNIFGESSSDFFDESLDCLTDDTLSDSDDETFDDSFCLPRPRKERISMRSIWGCKRYLRNFAPSLDSITEDDESGERFDDPAAVESTLTVDSQSLGSSSTVYEPVCDSLPVSEFVALVCKSHSTPKRCKNKSPCSRSKKLHFTRLLTIACY